jgi:hypothetical protein
VGVEKLLALVPGRVLPVGEDDDIVGGSHAVMCDYEWALVAEEWGVRFEGLLIPLRETPAQAVADALDFRDDVLACEFRELYRCEVMAARVEDCDDHSTLGWRGRFDLRLQPSS